MLTYSNGQVSNLGKVVGTDGSNGADGRGIQNVTLSASGDLSVVLTDNTVLTLGNVKGEKGDKGDKGDKGEKGDKGDPGEDGRGIADMEIVNGELIVTYTDGTQDNLGNVSTGEPTVDSRLIFTLQDDGTYEVTLDTKYKDTVTDISIPSTYNGIAVTAIGEKAFEQCSLLTTVTIPSSVTTIKEYAFSQCTHLKDTSLQNIESVGDYAFSGCTNLTNISIPRISSMGSYAFKDCSSLQNISLPTTLTEISRGAFWGCSSLTNVSLPATLTNIGDTSFNNCSFSSIVIPKSVTYIGPSAFTDNDQLQTVYFEKTDGWYRNRTITNPAVWQIVSENSLKDPEKAASLLLETGKISSGGTYAYYWRQNPPLQ